MRRSRRSRAIYDGADPRYLPAYGVSLAARYLRMPSATLKTWAFGRHYETKTGAKFSEPLFVAPDLELREISFMNFAEAFVLKAMRVGHAIPMQRVREALDSVSSALGIERPLIHKAWMTDGANLFIEHEGICRQASGQARQRIIADVIPHLERIEWDEHELARCILPFTRPHPDDLESAPRVVAIDARIAFGQPVISGTRVPTAALADRFSAGEDLDELCADYGLENRSVEEALRWELYLAKTQAA